MKQFLCVMANAIVGEGDPPLLLIKSEVSGLMAETKADAILMATVEARKLYGEDANIAVDVNELSADDVMKIVRKAAMNFGNPLEKTEVDDSIFNDEFLS